MYLTVGCSSKEAMYLTVGCSLAALSVHVCLWYTIMNTNQFPMISHALAYNNTIHMISIACSIIIGCIVFSGAIQLPRIQFLTIACLIIAVCITCCCPTSSSTTEMDMYVSNRAHVLHIIGVLGVSIFAPLYLIVTEKYTAIKAIEHAIYIALIGIFVCMSAYVTDCKTFSTFEPVVASIEYSIFILFFLFILERKKKISQTHKKKTNARLVDP